MLALAVRLAAEALKEKHILAEYQVIESLTRHKCLCTPILKAVQSWIGLRQQRRHLSKGLSSTCGVVSTSDYGPLLPLTLLSPSIFTGVPIHSNKFTKQTLTEMRESSSLIHICVCLNQIIAHFIACAVVIMSRWFNLGDLWLLNWLNVGGGKHQSSQMADWLLLWDMTELHPIIDTASLCHNRNRRIGVFLFLMVAILTHHCEVVGFKIHRT